MAIDKEYEEKNLTELDSIISAYINCRAEKNGKEQEEVRKLDSKIKEIIKFITENKKQISEDFYDRLAIFQAQREGFIRLHNIDNLEQFQLPSKEDLNIQAPLEQQVEPIPAEIDSQPTVPESTVTETASPESPFTTTVGPESKPTSEAIFIKSIPATTGDQIDLNLYSDDTKTVSTPSLTSMSQRHKIELARNMVANALAVGAYTLVDDTPTFSIDTNDYQIRAALEAQIESLGFKHTSTDTTQRNEDINRHGGSINRIKENTLNNNSPKQFFERFFQGAGQKEEKIKQFSKEPVKYRGLSSGETKFKNNVSQDLLAGQSAKDVFKDIVEKGVVAMTGIDHAKLEEVNAEQFLESPANIVRQLSDTNGDVLKRAAEKTQSPAAPGA